MIQLKIAELALNSNHSLTDSISNSVIILAPLSTFLLQSLDRYVFWWTISSHGYQGPGALMSQVGGLPNNSYKPITNTARVRGRVCKLQKGCTRLAAESDKAYQLLAHGRWFSPGTPASSTTKTGRHDIAEKLLKVALNTINQSNQSNPKGIILLVVNVSTLPLFIRYIYY